jgi:two-component system, NtrC family, sensor kinase
VRQSGGAIELESAPGKGTCLRIHLPRAKRQAVPLWADETSEPMYLASSPRRILLVKDNPDVAEITCDMLRNLGNRVETVNRAEAALDRLATGDSTIDIVSDIVMPDGMNGLQFAREIPKRYPTMPVVLVSGYSDTLTEAGAEFTVLSKPLTQSTLAAAIGQTATEMPGPRSVVDNTRRA